MSNSSDLLSRIVIDERDDHLKPCLKGSQMWVSSILSDLASGMTIKDILHQYPSLEREDILACFAYAAEMTGDITEVAGTIVEIQRGSILEFQC